MSSNVQITANQTNAQASTDPTTPEGKATSARNSFKHGLTCLIMNVTAEEHVAYQTHVSSYLDHHNPPPITTASWSCSKGWVNLRSPGSSHVVNDSRGVHVFVYRI
jgi:hypothetical protein